MTIKTFVGPSRDPDFAKNHIHGVMRQRESFGHAVKFVKDAANKVAVDVGAHIGIWTDAMASRFKHVVAFEPAADNFLCLARNAGKLENVTLYHGALGNGNIVGPAFTRMSLPTKGNSGMWHVYMQMYGGVKGELDPEAVPFAPLDFFEIKDVGLIKLDVEGFEGHVLHGAMTTLKESKPVVVFEDNGLGPRYYKDAWVDPKPILTSLGYKKRMRWQKDEIWL
jgi:FkbM family methyltransferase